MSTSPDSNKQTSAVDKRKKKTERKNFLNPPRQQGTSCGCPRITMEEVKEYLQTKAKAKKTKSSRQSKRTLKVMKFKYLEGKDSESGIPKLITAPKPQKIKKDLKAKSSKLIVPREETGKKQDQRDDRTPPSQVINNSSLSKSAMTTREKEYRPKTVTPKTNAKLILKKPTLKTSINRGKLQLPDLKATLSEMESKRIISLLKHLSLEKLQSVQNSITRILKAKNEELIVAKHVKIEKLRDEIEHLHGITRLSVPSDTNQ